MKALKDYISKEFGYRFPSKWINEHNYVNEKDKKFSKIKATKLNSEQLKYFSDLAYNASNNPLGKETFK
jgi:hypothetical protein